MHAASAASPAAVFLLVRMTLLPELTSLRATSRPRPLLPPAGQKKQAMSACQQAPGSFDDSPVIRVYMADQPRLGLNDRASQTLTDPVPKVPIPTYHSSVNGAGLDPHADQRSHSALLLVDLFLWCFIGFHAVGRDPMSCPCSRMLSFIDVL